VLGFEEFVGSHGKGGFLLLNLLGSIGLLRQGRSGVALGYEVLVFDSLEPETCKRDPGS
jgi:hypothetical protein